MHKEDVKFSLLLVLTTAVSYFEIAFFMFSTKWDNLSAFFPYKYTAGHWWLSGNIPFWDPYQNLGYPMHANPQGGVWYPISWLLSLPNGYNLYSLNLEVVIHIAIAAIGMYFLAKRIGIKAGVAFLAGLAYSLSGFMMGTSHMIGFTVGAAWLPWIIIYLIRALNNPNAFNVICFSLLIYLQLVGAYAAFSIILLYLLAGYVIYFQLKDGLSKTRLKNLAILGTTSLLLVGLFTAPYLYSIYDSLDYFSRAEPLSYDPRQFGGNFSPLCFISLIVPYVVSSAEGFVGVDVSLANVFIGIPFLLFFVLYVISYKQRFKWLFVSLVGLFFLLALGLHTPVHQAFHSYVPGFNMFRHPYLFVLYSILLMVLLGGRYLSHSLASNKFKGIKLSYLVFVVGGFFSLILLISKIDFTAWGQYVEQIKLLSETSPLNGYSHAFLQLSVFLVLSIIVLISLAKKKWFVRVLPIALFFELFLAVQLNAPKNLYYNVKFAWLNDYLAEEANESLTNQLATSSLDTLRNKNIRSSAGFWVNLNTYKRTTGIGGYNPFIFSRYIQFQESGYFDKFIENGVVYTAKDFGKNGDYGYHNLGAATEIDSGTITAFEIGFNRFNIAVSSRSKTRLFLNQNYHHNWVAEVNGEQVKIDRSNMSLMSISLDAGRHEVSFVYDSGVIRKLHYTSLITLILSVLSLVLIPLLMKRG